MNLNNVNDNFNVGTPTKENIECAFKNLLYYLTCSTVLELYETKWEEFEQVLKKVKNIIKEYIASGSLLTIDQKILEDIKFDLIDLEVETQILNSYYAEWSFVWFEAIMSLRLSEQRTGGIINVK